jgi:hypothetical protein
MPRKRPTPEEIVAKPRQIDVRVSQGKRGRRYGAVDWNDPGDILKVAQGIRRAKEGSGQEFEGP